MVSQIWCQFRIANSNFYVQMRLARSSAGADSSVTQSQQDGSSSVTCVQTTYRRNWLNQQLNHCHWVMLEIWMVHNLLFSFSVNDIFILGICYVFDLVLSKLCKFFMAIHIKMIVGILWLELFSSTAGYFSVKVTKVYRTFHSKQF